MRTASPLTAALLALMLAGCGSTSNDDPAAATTPDTVEPTTAAPTFDYANATEDTHSDGLGADLLSVTLAPSGDVLQVTWELMSAPFGQTGYYLAVSSLDGEAAGQLGVKVNRQTVTDHFVFLDNQNTYLNSAATVVGNEVRASFPLATIQDVLGDEFKWYATTTANGSDVDTAPDNTDPLNPEYLIFQRP